MSSIGEKWDWFACADCAWSTAGIWALEESDTHRTSNPRHLMMGDAEEWKVQGLHRFVSGCPACDLYVYLSAWAEWEARYAKLWADHADMVGPDSLDDDSEPEGIEWHFARKPVPPATCVWLGELDDQGSPLQAIARLLPRLSCREHE